MIATSRTFFDICLTRTSEYSMTHCLQGKGSDIPSFWTSNELICADSGIVSKWQLRYCVTFSRNIIRKMPEREMAGATIFWNSWNEPIFDNLKFEYWMTFWLSVLDTPSQLNATKTLPSTENILSEVSWEGNLLYYRFASRAIYSSYRYRVSSLNQPLRREGLKLK